MNEVVFGEKEASSQEVPSYLGTHLLVGLFSLCSLCGGPKNLE